MLLKGVAGNTRFDSPCPESTERIREAIMDLMRGFSIEISPPMAAATKNLPDLGPRGTKVFIPSSPHWHFFDIIKTAERLNAQGFKPCPHVAARSIPNYHALEKYIAELRHRSGVTAILALAGSARKSAGPYGNSMELLETGLFERLGIANISVAGHPEGIPNISCNEELSALRWKNAYSVRTSAHMNIVTQFCFDAAPIMEWERRVRALGIRLAIRVGIPGPATLRSLLRYAKICGIGPSATLLTKEANNLTKPLSIQSPHILVRDLAVHRAQCSGCLIEGIHVYPFGGHARTLAWINAIIAGAFSIKLSERGFTLKRPIG